MILTPSIPKNVWYATLVEFTILFGGFFILQHVSLAKRDVAATSLLADIVITFPLVYYFLVIRPLHLKKSSLLLIFTCCCMVAYFTLPAHQQYYILQLRKLSVLVELSIVIYAIRHIKKITVSYKRLQDVFPDFAHNLSKSMAAVLGNHKSVKLLASELVILRFGLFCWKKPTRAALAVKRFTVYKESGYTSLFGVLLVVFMIELMVVHLLLLHYSKNAAFFVSLLSLYGLVFIVADLSATVKSPVLLLKDQLLLRTGLRWRVLVSISNIASIEKIKDSHEPDKECFKGGILKSSVNVLITFKHPVSIERIYRSPVTASKIIMSIDRADEFIAQMES
ncbi:hypothetical protein EON73_03175 [bacterium]|nr:MAG: hypothetical protein EON73_03175 [bacterium]